MSTSEKPVTVIIPCFNAGEWVTEAVDSVMNGNPEADLIVIDDGSTDPETLTALRNIQARDICVIRTENHGVSHARNVGIEQATSPYILPLDADDLLSPGAVAHAISYFQDPAVAVVASAQHRFGAVDEIRACTYTDYDSMWPETTLPNTSFFRRADWERAGGYPEGITTCEDWIFWLRILRLGGSVAVLPDVLHEYRVSEKQVSHSPDPIAIMEAQNLALRENAERLPLEYIVEIATHNRSEAAHLRAKYGRLDTLGRRAKQLLRR